MKDEIFHSGKLVIYAPEAEDAVCGGKYPCPVGGEVATVDLRDAWPTYHNTDEMPTYAEARANARLFGAAPKLCEAIRQYLQTLEEQETRIQTLATSSVGPIGEYVVRAARASQTKKALAVAQPLYVALSLAQEGSVT